MHTKSVWPPTRVYLNRRMNRIVLILEWLVERSNYWAARRGGSRIVSSEASCGSFKFSSRLPQLERKESTLPRCDSNFPPLNEQFNFLPPEELGCQSIWESNFGIQFKFLQYTNIFMICKSSFFCKISSFVSRKYWNVFFIFKTAFQSRRLKQVYHVQPKISQFLSKRNSLSAT